MGRTVLRVLNLKEEIFLKLPSICKTGFLKGPQLGQQSTRHFGRLFLCMYIYRWTNMSKYIHMYMWYKNYGLFKALCWGRTYAKTLLWNICECSSPWSFCHRLVTVYRGTWTSTIVEPNMTLHCQYISYIICIALFIIIQWVLAVERASKAMMSTIPDFTYTMV